MSVRPHLIQVVPAIFLTLATVLCSCFIALPTQAQTQDSGIRLTTSPLPISLSAKPGQTVTTDLRIRNSGNQPETLKVGLLKFSADDQTGQAELAEREVGDDYFDWVTFSDKEFTLSPNQWHTTRMTIKVPKDAAFGYYYAATFSRVDKDGTDQSQQAVLLGSTATLVLLEVESPNARRQVEIEDFSTDKDWYEFLPTTFTVRLKNTGNIHSMVSGNIFVSRDGQSVATLEVNSLRGSILPDSIRQFTTDWTDGFPVYTTKVDQQGNPIYKDSQPQHNLTWNFSQADKLRFGKYTAQVVLAYDNGTRDVPLEATVDFWVIPWRIIAAAIVVSGLTLTGLLMIGRAIWKVSRNRSYADDF